ncbi:unnamed protein product [Ceutorhynchus assimilis]|uniref:Histone-lysine N-methyltransferase ash1 n=1 Tax=Ceutorhynchus assimilis TaxID=467358 RepID=A0A9P0DP74_9CUCU|nr:unnamed protein product [Ceutorhynchus assimilis]
MATNDGATTELFTGWSSVVHQPEDEPEESELPSTVDIGALSAEPPDPAPTQNNLDTDSESEDSEADSSNSDNSEASQESCSDSSDSDSSSSSQESSSRSPSPEFSVTSSQTNGLRLTIATIRKNAPSPVATAKKIMVPKKVKGNKKSTTSSSSCSSDSDTDDSDISEVKITQKCTKKVAPLPSKPKAKQSPLLVKQRPISSNSSPVPKLRLSNEAKTKPPNENSSSRDSTKFNKSNTNTTVKLRQKDAVVGKLRSSKDLPLKSVAVDEDKVDKNAKTTETRTSKKKVKVKKKTRKMASLPLSRSSTYSSSDSESSVDLLPASCSLQEIRQEDLAAILPDQSECNDFNDFDKNDKNSPATGDMSGSDMELPQQAINSLIQRTTESSSDGEGHQLPNPQTLFANSLLQQFVPSNPLLSPPTDHTLTSDSVSPSKTSNKPENIAKTEIDEPIVKRGRGRPKRLTTRSKKQERSNERNIQEFCGLPNVSPDSGIQNSPDHVSSPEPSLSPNIRHKETKNKISQERYSKRIMAKEKQTHKKGSESSSRTSSQEKVPITKQPITSNQFDRVLYANADRVLYPPRRKVGRPPVNKRPGRPPKNNVEAKVQEKPILVQKNKIKPTIPVAMIKVPKILHSRHKHKHKKRKFKILKPPVPSDPKINQEIDKLIGDFVKCCVIAAKQPKEIVPEQVLKTLKKVTKKRRTTDYMEKKKKKQSVSTTINKVPNSNEQRLPLKKRHYHLVSNSSENPKPQPETSEESKVEAKTEKKEKPAKDNNKVIKGHINNNEYEVKAERIENEASVHIEEAIEACINKFANKLPTTEEKSPESKTVPATTPKKRHRLENLQPDTESTPEIKTEIDEKIEKLKTSITVESYINELKIKRNLMGTKSTTEEVNDKKLETDSNKTVKIKDEAPTILTDDDKVENIVPVSQESTKKKVRKRRTYNRTGFPSIKRKKKKTMAVESAPKECISNIAQVCDRVPKQGEEIKKFLQRSSASKSSKLEPPSEDNSSECESLPQDQRMDSEDSQSETDNPNENLSLLESSIERLRSRLDQKTRKRTKNLPESIYPKRRKREESPASSIEPQAESTSGDELSKKKKTGRKKYLVAGLFSDYYKEEEPRRQDITKSTRSLVYNPEEHPFGLLPPPIHCGKSFRKKRIDFQLPYDIWWQHTHSQLPGSDVVPSWNYRKVRSNVYNVKNNGGACEPQSCNCKATSNCEDDCINRLVLAECPPSHKCQNQRIQKHDWAPGIEKFMTEDKGWGVRTKEMIKQGDFILEYVGEVVSDQEFKERMNSIYVNDTHHYCLHLDSGLVIDGHRMGSDGRFVNHSCEPNCEIQKWSVNGQFRMVLFALRDIKPYEELTYDYNFSLFNLAEGQECKCRSDQCRGVIGGKTQRTRQLPEASLVPKNPGRVGRPRKNEAKKKETSTASIPPPQSQIIPQIQVKPMSHQQKCFILEHHCFLLRNLTKVRKVRHRSQSVTSSIVGRQQTATPTDSSAFNYQLNALQKPRSMKTRKITQAEDDPELNKTIKLAGILKEILMGLTTAKGDKGENLSTHINQLPSKRKVPQFYQKVPAPIDLATVQQNVATGVYKTPQAFDEDMIKLFTGFSKYYPRTTEIGVATSKLKKLYNEIKHKCLTKFEDLLGKKTTPTFANSRKKNEEEDIIRCICGIPRDEGLMIQCERCTVWQHIECVNADASAASYHCEVCVPRKVDYEIPMDDYTEHGHKYYMTLMRGELQLRQGDTVYVLRDISIPGTNKKHTYETIGKIDYSELDIFRIERLWKDKDTGKRFAYGHHYLRPHETFHEPTRKFFSNEVMRVPLYEAVPVELVMERCWVMDINTFCKGRPIGAQEDHIYICEYRVDKAAKMFSKVSKNKFPICTKSFAFEQFETRLKISRTYCPHDVDESLLKNGAVGRKPASNSTQVPSTSSVAITIQKTPAQQKLRLNKILLNLLSKMPGKQVLDVSYLLEAGRRRKKQEIKQ